MDDFFRAPSLNFDGDQSQSAHKMERSLDSQFSLAPKFSTQAHDLFTVSRAKSDIEQLSSLDVTPLVFSNMGFVRMNSIDKADLVLDKDG